MTAQIYERLLYKGEAYPMAATPLDDYLFQQGIASPFREANTALWRRYVGAWEIRDDRLWLTEIFATLEDGSPATLQAIFPDQTRPVFAAWYTGVLRLPRGKQLKYVHMGFGSTHEEDVMLSVEKGVVVSSETKRNKRPFRWGIR
jgi:hypothetical protein